MNYVLIKNGVVVQRQPYPEPGFIEAPDDVICGYLYQGGKFSRPVPRIERGQLLAAVNTLAEGKLSALAVAYPPGEVKSWPTQVAEAEAVKLDANAATPLLSAVAAARGVPLGVLAERVLAKAHAYAAASGAIIGRRQALEDQIAAAADGELASIDIAAGWPEVVQ